MLIVHVAFECSPIYKTGGLGDVVGSLPKELHKLGIASAVIMPGYGWIKRLSKLPGSEVKVFYAESKYFDAQNKIHDPKLQAPKYAHFALLVLEELKRRNLRPDIIHCHDWHTGLVPFLLKKKPDAFFEHTKCIITLHNIAFQGNFPVSYLATPQTQLVHDLFDKHTKRIFYLKEGIRYADYITTVSANHAREIRSGIASFGFKQLIRKKRGKFTGIINGLDLGFWNPRTDSHISKNYNLTSVFGAKAENKIKLQKALGLEVSGDIPLYGFVARLSSQKGIDLLLPVLDIVAKKRMQLVILGSGDKKIEEKLKSYQTKEHRHWISVNFGFDESLAHQIYASSDFFLIPSHYEPCGLTQMISMVYGTLPIASAVGGLKDTIDEGKNGWLFMRLTSDGLLQKINSSLQVWENQTDYQKMVASAMRKDFSWKKSGRKYARLYSRVLHL